jgi:hypothetical protein
MLFQHHHMECYLVHCFLHSWMSQSVWDATVARNVEAFCAAYGTARHLALCNVGLQRPTLDPNLVRKLLLLLPTQISLVSTVKSLRRMLRTDRHKVTRPFCVRRANKEHDSLLKHFGLPFSRYFTCSFQLVLLLRCLTLGICRIVRRVCPLAAVSYRLNSFGTYEANKNVTICFNWPPLWSSGQSAWLQTWVRFPALPDFLRSSSSAKGSTQPREDNWEATWKDSSGSSL